MYHISVKKIKEKEHENNFIKAKINAKKLKKFPKKKSKRQKSAVLLVNIISGYNIVIEIHF
ncbi:hypothetical protein ANG6_1404 [Streptococcus anginosus T5]|uniref:Uncharacterized protein n=1 Tax=Streptococcus anginosus T5 TaxID=1163302 RepID=A0AAN4T625_STRAP|nr:hypothetical protein ANG6_1404 [Streptococcus anginosus T5]